MNWSDRLVELNLELPPVVAAVGSYVPALRSGDLVFTSGQLPMQSGELVARGKLGVEVDESMAYQAAQVAVLNALAAIAAEVGLDNIVQIVKLTGFVAVKNDFYAPHKVVNGASDLLIKIFGSKGKHARSAVGVAALPLNASVEIELIAQLGSVS